MTGGLSHIEVLYRNSLERGERFHKAEFGAILADFSFEALERQFKRERRVGLIDGTAGRSW